MKGSRGFTLVEVVISVAIIAILSLFLINAGYTARTGIKQTKCETIQSNMAFAVLDAIRAEADDLDLNDTVTLADLGLANPNSLQVTIISERDDMLPDLYVLTVQVEEPNGRCESLTMYTLIRKCSN